MNLKAPLIILLNEMLSVEISIGSLHSRAILCTRSGGHHYPASVEQLVSLLSPLGESKAVSQLLRSFR